MSLEAILGQQSLIYLTAYLPYQSLVSLLLSTLDITTLLILVSSLVLLDQKLLKHKALHS